MSAPPPSPRLSPPDRARAPSTISRKRTLRRSRKLALSLTALLDPRFWAHLWRRQAYHYTAHVLPVARISMGRGCVISPFAVFANPENITFGAQVRIGDRCYFWAGHGSATIRVGDNAMFGPDVLVTTSRYRYEDGQPTHAQQMDESDVVIGEDVWIGARAVILPGARIGAGSVIGAGAVIQGEIPPMSVALGMPARVAMKRPLPEPGTV